MTTTVSVQWITALALSCAAAASACTTNERKHDSEQQPSAPELVSDAGAGNVGVDVDAGARARSLLGATLSAVVKFKNVRFRGGFAVIDERDGKTVVGVVGTAPPRRKMSLLFHPEDVVPISEDLDVADLSDRRLSAIVTEHAGCSHVWGEAEAAARCPVMRPMLRAPTLPKAARDAGSKSRPGKGRRLVGLTVADALAALGATPRSAPPPSGSPKGFVYVGARGGKVPGIELAVRRGPKGKAWDPSELGRQPVVGLRLNVPACSQVVGAIQFNRKSFAAPCK